MHETFNFGKKERYLPGAQNFYSMLEEIRKGNDCYSDAQLEISTCNQD